MQQTWRRTRARTVNVVETVLQKRSDAIACLEKELRDARARIGQLEGAAKSALHQRFEEVARLKKQLGKARARIAQLERAAQSALQQRLEEIGHSEEELREVRSSIAQLEVDAKLLHQRHLKEVTCSEEELREARARIADLEGAAQQALSQHSEEVSRLRTELAEARLQLTDVSAKLVAFAVELDSIRSSRSWRCTQPIRWFSTKVRSIERSARRIVNLAASSRRVFGLAARESADDLNLIIASGIFDRDWYLNTYAEIESGVDPELHYLQQGWLEGCQPSPLFDGAWYLEQNRDVAESGANPLLHYLKVGAFEGRDPHPLFHAKWYLAQYPDITEKSINPLTHYLLFGASEGRNPNPLFDTKWYLSRHQDVADKGVNPLTHYLQFGAAESRYPNPLFDSKWYVLQYPDVAARGANPLVHYLQIGAAEGRDPSPVFNVRWYLSKYPDVADAGVNPLYHYLQYGAGEGRDLGPDTSSQEIRSIINYLTSGVNSYSLWIKKFDTITDDDRAIIRNNISNFTSFPTISIVMPVFNTEPLWLERSINSILNQLYQNFELCISDDASTLPEIKILLERYMHLDHRIRVNFRETNGHISANSNSALALASSEWVALMDADDELPEHALFWVARELLKYPQTDLIYSDEDKIDTDGRRFEPYFKSDWNIALMTSQNMFSHLGIYRRSLLERIGGFRVGFEGSQDHDLVLRCAELTSPDRIRHIPRILYHWRAIPGSAAQQSEAKPYAWQAGARAIEDHLARVGTPGSVRRALKDFYQVDYQSNAQNPKVSIIIPSAFRSDLLERCIDSIFAKSSYSNFEVLTVINERTATKSVANIMKDARVKVLGYEYGSFNYSKINNFAVSQADGKIICLLNDDIEVITPNWLETLVARLSLPRVGVVSPLLLYPNDTIQHAGIILGLGGVAGHPFRRLPRGHAGYFGRAALEQDLSAVTGACMMVRREVFELVNGFNEKLAIAFNDVDLCVRIRKAGWRILWTPAVELYHYESASVGTATSPERKEGFQAEVSFMRERWAKTLEHDPFYNPNLSLSSLYSGLSFPPRLPSLPADGDI